MTYKQEKITPYGNGQEKRRQVERMFDSIAHSYDLLNRRLSLGIDKMWRDYAINRLKPYKPEVMLDIATGTGDFAILAAKKLKPKKVTGIDISENMMQIGEQKVKEEHLEDIISFQKGDCERLPYNDNTFNSITTAFGIRNFQNLDLCLKEMQRVLKPGGQACILELSCPKSFPMKQLFWLYSHTVLPLFGKIVSKDKNAYSYLTTTIEAFPQGEVMTGILRKAGFTETKFKRLTFGICTCYLAIK